MLELVAQIFANSLQREQFARDIRYSESYYRTMFENTCAAVRIGQPVVLSDLKRE
ncbi:MAG: hypothetical protein NTV45_04535 [Firmicutes bacterium]|nr:hypothetical protein [Bacillota bacterium]